ncbi:hypothetical protein UA08_05643 [Talaromyces atroroseus]|uniref:Uncharacterized protein n=1 Tax=Talaromyces atroroseus TaxID=1441469 RepID=A0A225AHU3_TALAT|nr:hypothetical protein UA08_05643 [Talaromyces atroroseus]OKL58853.1 hypothetical protein UA08_05643 [Talaromyces atroroseus]
MTLIEQYSPTPAMAAAVAALLLVVTLVLIISVHAILATSQQSPVPKTRRKGTPTHVLIVLGSGGHTAEMLSMLRRMPLDPNVYTFRTYIVTSGDGFSASKAAEFEATLQTQYRNRNSSNDDGSQYYEVITVPRARRVHQSYLTAPWSTIQCFWACLQVLRAKHADQQSRKRGGATSPYPDLILTNGPATANRNVLVTAGSRGLGALVAEKFAAEGANVAINYVSNVGRAEETASKIKSQYQVKTTIIQGDLGVKEDCIKVVKTAVDELGGLDIVISNAGWTKFAKFDDLDATEESDWDKCWAVNVKGHLHIFREALPTFNANPDGGVFLVTASIAGLGASGSSLPYSVSKAACNVSPLFTPSLHLTKCLAKSQGPKVRVNAVCPGLLLTEWGNQFSAESIHNHIEKTALKRVVSNNWNELKGQITDSRTSKAELEDTADLYITLAKNSSMTGQSMAVDAGFTLA